MKIVISYFLIMCIIAFCLMYIDKNKAINGEWRISESTLINFSILGGGLGAFLGMYVFRHKTKHPKFTIGIPLTIIFNLVSIYYIYMII